MDGVGGFCKVGLEKEGGRGEDAGCERERAPGGGVGHRGVYGCLAWNRGDAIVERVGEAVTWAIVPPGGVS